MQQALDTALERATPGQQQDFWAEVTRPASDDTGEQGDDTDRRLALRAIAALTGGLATAAYLESVDLDRLIEASDLGPETLQQLSLGVERLGLDYLHSPPSQTFEAARATRQYVAQLLNGRHTLAQRAQLYAVAGWLSALIGHAAFDLGQDGVVDSHSGTALHLAREVDHGELVGWVRGTQALAATYQNRPEDAIALAQAGLDVAPDGSITVVRLYAQEARAHARVGDRIAAERALAAAERNLDRAVGTPTTSIFSFAYPYLPYYAGTCYTWLGLPQRAEPCSGEAIVLCDAAAADWPVARVFARVDLASAFIQQNELGGAAELVGECLDICAQGRRTDPMAARLSDLLRDLKMRVGVSPVRDLEEQFRALFSS